MASSTRPTEDSSRQPGTAPVAPDGPGLQPDTLDDQATEHWRAKESNLGFAGAVVLLLALNTFLYRSTVQTTVVVAGKLFAVALVAIAMFFMNRNSKALRRSREHLRRLSVELRMQNHKILRANRLKTQFLANMSHELRTPLNAILGFTELIQDGVVSPNSPKYKESLECISSSGHHLLRLVNDILDLSKLEAGKLQFHPEPLNLTELVEELKANLRSVAILKKIDVAVAIDPSIGMLSLDPARLSQIFSNYLSNALKFAPQGGRVAIRALSEGARHFRLEVEDNGIGIHPHDLDRLFSEFEQLDAGPAKEYAGTGLGLALTRRLVEAQGGTVGVTSTLGKGSIFHAVLPRQFPLPANSLESPKAEVLSSSTGSPWVSSPGTSSSSEAGPNILVIDDDPISLKLMAAGLNKLGYRASCHPDGAVALRALAEEKPQAVVLDLLMPGMSGFDFLDRIHERSRNDTTPIIVWTVKDLTPEERNRVESSVQAVVPKGSGTAAVLHHLQRLLPRAVPG